MVTKEKKERKKVHFQSNNICTMLLLHSRKLACVKQAFPREFDFAQQLDWKRLLGAG